MSSLLVLVVDDEPDVRDSMAAALAARGCSAMIASGAADAIADAGDGGGPGGGRAGVAYLTGCYTNRPYR